MEVWGTEKSFISSVPRLTKALCRPLRELARWALSEADFVCVVANLVIPTKLSKQRSSIERLGTFLFSTPPNACINGGVGNRKELYFERATAYESFVQTIKGASKMGVKRSRLCLRSSQSCHPDKAE